MSKPSDLCSLAAAQAWAGTTSSLIPYLITSTSRQILSYLNRGSILPNSYNEIRDGSGIPRMLLRNYPVISVSSVIVNHVPILPAGSPFTTGITPTFSSYGYLLEPWDGFPPGSPQWVDIHRTTFFSGRQNVAFSYRAGYQVTNEPQIVAASLTAEQPYGAWATDEGVTYAATGVSLTPVTGPPSVGQYSVQSGLYTFNAADVGQNVLISYGFVPADLAQATAQWVGELVSYQGRLGMKSKSVGGQETVTFDTSAIPDRVCSIIGPYCRVALL